MTTSLRVGIAGLGTVGASVIRLLDRQADALAARTGRKISVTAVSARDKSRDRGVEFADAKWFDDPVVELIGGAEGPAREAVEAALASGKPVVTANKALLAKHGMPLARLAEEKRVALAFEASVAGGIPIVKTLREGLAGNEISRVYGILNGTCNYILSRMEQEGLSFDDCLKEAQRLGYAEADPTLDAEAIHVEGITSIRLEDLRSADELGYRIKLLGVAQRTADGIEQRVHPTMVPKSSAIAQVMGVTNAVTIDADAVKELTLVGPGAGGDATASAVVADIADVARGIRSAPFGLPSGSLSAPARRAMQRHEGGYYIRLSVHDRPGAAANIAMRMAERQISLESIMQKGLHRKAPAGAPVPVVLITYATTEGNIREALEAAVGDGYIAEKPQVIRIERE
jgi:homoserine dehydrogenase